MAFIMVAMSAAPGFSPLIGGLLDTTAGWRSEFFVVGVFGATAAVAYFWFVGETHRPETKIPVRLTDILRGYGKLTTDLRFIAPAGTIGLSMGAVFAMFSGSPRVVIEDHGFSALHLGLFFASTVFAVFGSGMLAPRLAIRVGHHRATTIGLAIAAAGGIALLLSQGISHSIWSYVISVMIFLAGYGLVSSLATATALQPFGDRAGLASALLGFLQMAGATLGVILTASIADATLAVGVVQTMLTVLGLILYLAGTRQRLTEK